MTSSEIKAKYDRSPSDVHSCFTELDKLVNSQSATDVLLRLADVCESRCWPNLANDLREIADRYATHPDDNSK